MILRIAWHQAISSFRVRRSRHLLTWAGIALGTAIYAALGAYGASASSVKLLPEDAAKLQWFAILAMAMTATGVTNAMAISVTERFREIGTLKCLGASNGLVVAIFLLEAALLGISGAFAGAAVGSWLGMRAAGGTTFSLGPAFAVGGATAFVSAFIPAWIAARMPAIAALRTEI